MTSVPAPQSFGSTPTTKQKSKSSRKSLEKDKDKDGDLVKEEKADRLKTVVRRLPPTLPEEVFWQSVQPWVTEETVSWKVYHSGKVRKRPNKESIPSRAYIAFRSEDQLATFSQAYDGHLFRDKAGNESIAVVEFAPYQKIPSEKKKADARCNTIDKDEDYISFLKSLESKGSTNNDEPSTLESLIAASQPLPQPKTTPLLEALKAQKEKELAIRVQIQQRKDRDHAAALKDAQARKDLEKKAGKAAKPAAQAAASGVSTETAKKGRKAKAAAAAAAAAIANAAQAKAGPSGSAGTPATVASPKKPSKAPRPPRPPPAQQPQAPAALKPQASSEEQTGTTTPGLEPVQPRRVRPVIATASRGFEAALSGAGVAGVAVGKRRAKEKADREAAASGAGPSEPSATPAVDAAKEKEIQARKDRDRERERRRREKEKEDAAKSGGSAAPAPTILVRDVPPKILARPPATDTQSPAGVLNVNANPPGAAEGETIAARGGGRRGRGRGGRGFRGGAPLGS